MASFPFGYPAMAGGSQAQQQQQQQPAISSSSSSNNNGGGSHPDDEEMIDAIERILSAEENRKIQAASLSACREGGGGSAAASGPLMASELSILSLLCTKAASGKTNTNNNRSNAGSSSSNRGPIGFGAVDGDLLSTLTELLEKHVNQAVGVDLVQEAISVLHKREIKVDQWLKNGYPGGDRVAALRLGLEAASILLFIATSPGVESRVASEDAIEAAFTLLRHHLNKNVIPALNNTGHLLATQAMEEEKGITSPRSQRKRKQSGSGDANPVVRELKKVYRPIINLMDLHLQLMERVEGAVQSLFVDDQHIITLTTGALDALEIESNTPSSQNPANRLQVATIALVTAVFCKFPMHRASIIEDLFPLMLRIPAHKRTMRTFPVRYSSCPSPYTTQSLNTTLFSELLSNGHPPHYIQMMTALLLSLIQSTIARPTFAAPNNNNNNNHEEEDAPEGDNGTGEPSLQYVSGLRACQSVADMFAVQLLQRCSRKGEDGGASEFRPILANLVEDLLLVLMVPEYPAAQMVLLSCTNVLSRDVIQSSQAGVVTVESTYINTAFDTLGRICSAYAKILAAQRQREFPTTPTQVPEDRRHVRCYCKRNEWTDTLMIDCDQCHIWYHAQCIGMNRDALPNEWLCDTCTLQTVLLEERGVHGNSEKSRSIVNSSFAMHRVLQSHLKNLYGGEVAAHFHLAKWTEELQKQSLSKQASNNGSSAAAVEVSHQVIIAHLLEEWDSSGQSVASRSSPLRFTEEGGIRALLYLTTSYSNFTKSFNAQMGLMLKLMSDKAHPSLRKLSVKAVEKVVEADPKLMLLTKVMNAVSQRLSDESISVREAVVSLVGSYVVTSPAVANAFHQQLIARLLDPGVSVRKRTVKILQDILCTNPHYKGRSDACNKCLQRASDPKEDDGVREALHAMFMKLWLEDGDILVASQYEKTPTRNGIGSSSPPTRSPPVANADGTSPASGVVTLSPTPTDGRSTRSKQKEFGKLRSELAAEQMVAAVKIAGTNENLGSFMRELLCNVNDSDKGRKAAERMKRQKIAEKQCFHLVDALFEVLLSTEEKRGDFGDSIGAELVAIVRTIQVFSEVSTSAVMKHLGTILPYLKADNGLTMSDESSLASAASDIVYRLAPILDQDEIQRLSAGSLAPDLVNITYKFGSAALHSATRALVTLAHRSERKDSKFGKKLMELAMTSYAYLYKKEKIDDFSSDSNLKSNVQRLLLGLGVLCRTHEVNIVSSVWDEEVEAEELELFEPTEVAWSSVPIAAFRLFTTYLSKPDVSIQCTALRALSSIFVQHPRLMLACAQSGLIEEVMSSDSPLELQMEALRCWRDISLAEEKRIDSGEAKKKMDSKETITTSKKISGDQDGDSNLVGGVLTKQTGRLFEMTQAKEDGLRITSLELLAQLLRQGMVNPNESVPFLLALQGDVENMVVRKFALALLITEGEKRPDMLRQRVCAGIKQACKFQKEAYPTKEVSALIKVKKGNRVDYESVFDNVFRECIISSRKQREGLYKRLLGMFERAEEPNGVSTTSETPSSTKKKKSRSRRSSAAFEELIIEADISLLSFAAQVLAYLPYSSYGDPLFIQHHISSIVALQGPQLLDKLAAFLRPYGLSSSDEFDEPNAKEDALETAAKSGAPSRAEEAEPLLAENFDWPGFVELCKEASSLALLLRLKAFLTKRYALKSSVCLAYTPDSKDRSFGRTIISRQDNMPLFDSSVATVSPDNIVHGDEDRLIHHYAAFRRLMREETKAEEEAIDMIEPELETGVDEDMMSDSEENDEGEDGEPGEAGPSKKKRRRSSATGASAKKPRKRKSTGGSIGKKLRMSSV